MFIDRVHIYVKGGDGGNGIVSWRREMFVPLGGPAGGDGGNGGSIILRVDEGLRTLIDFRYQKHFKGDRGEYGKTSNKHGKNAKDKYLKVPPGTVVRDADTDEFLGDLTRQGQELVVAKGGRGGFGNTHFASQVNKAPDMAEKGEPGQERWLTLELKVLADVGLVGFPSVGKSTFLSVVSSAKPKIAEYHFTTLAPNLGMVAVGDERSFVLADLPGLIEGAHEGHGLGQEFLRHVERTRVIIHVIDMGAVEGRDPIEDYQIIHNELVQYDLRLEDRPQLIAANKMDVPGAEENLEKFRAAFPDLKIFPISGVTGEGVQALLYATADLLDSIPPEKDLWEEPVEEEDLSEVKVYKYVKQEPFKIYRENNIFTVESEELEKLVKMTNFQQYDAVQRFQRIMKAQGVDDALRKRGAKEGDMIHIGDMAFDFVE